MVKNQKGVTLIELLVAIAILSAVLLIASSIHLFGQKQMTDQTAEIQNQSNVRLAMSIITKQIRMASAVDINNNVLTINGVDVYQLENNNLTKNGQPLVNNLQMVNIKFQGDFINIVIANLPSSNHPQTTLSSTIYRRN